MLTDAARLILSDPFTITMLVTCAISVTIIVLIIDFAYMSYERGADNG